MTQEIPSYFLEKSRYLTYLRTRLCLDFIKKDSGKLKFGRIENKYFGLSISTGNVGRRPRVREIRCNDRLIFVQSVLKEIEKFKEKGYQLDTAEQQVLDRLKRKKPRKIEQCEFLFEEVVTSIETALDELNSAHRLSVLNRLAEANFFDLIDLFENIRSGWKMKLKPQKFSDTDRMGSHLFGNMYCSKKYPWPSEDDSGEKIPFYPIAQLNLEELGQWIDGEIGSGLLQLFDPAPTNQEYIDEGLILRHVPKAEVSSDLHYWEKI